MRFIVVIYVKFIVLFVSVSVFALEGQIIAIDKFLREPSRLALSQGNFEAKFPYPGPGRARIKNMLEAMVKSVRNGRAFNPSIIAAIDGYAMAVRVAFHSGSVGLFSEAKQIIPGNRAQSNFEKGKNFWWQDFASKDFEGGTLYFYADKDLERFSFLAPQNYMDYPNWIFGQDIRLFRGNDGVATFNPKLSSQYAASLIDSFNIGANTVGSLLFKHNLLNIKPGNNYGIFDLDFANGTYSYIDWFFKEGILFSRAQVKEKKVFNEYLKFVDDDYPIIGTGSTLEDGNNAGHNSGIMPLFSFGSPHIKLDEHTYFGVGHTKIHVDEELFKYREGSNINRFRTELTTDFKEAYGDRYVRHDAYNSNLNKAQGYHYLMYFYWFRLNSHGKPIEMKISDSYLPIDMKAAALSENYVFSLVFPAGVTEKIDDKSKLLISAGIGDYYSVLLELPKDFLIELCRHDATNLDMKNYDYKLMRFDGEGHFDIVDRL